MSHGAKEPLFGVKVADLKQILRKTKKDHALALQLYATGNCDAMYLAGLMADEKKVTRETLETWVKQAYFYYLSEHVVPWIAAESPYGQEVAIPWINSDNEKIASAGWSTLSYLTYLKEDAELDLNTYSALLDRVITGLSGAAPRVKYTMNGFVIAVAINVVSLREQAIRAAGKTGKFSIDMGGTACKVPYATEYIEKALKAGRAQKKRKTVR